MGKKRNSIEFQVSGKYALFSEVVTRIGGEKFSYPVPTYQSLKGITESCYWKPTFIWVIDEVRIMNKIQTESKGVRPLLYTTEMKKGNRKTSDLSYYTYLKDVNYQVLAHFEWNTQREDLAGDRNENKHHNIAKRSVALGGRRDVFLGARECQGYIEPCEFGSGKGFYDDYGDLNMGYMFHSFRYPDENEKHNFTAQFWHPVMHNGVIEFPGFDSASLDTRVIREAQAIKNFEMGRNFKVEEEDL